MQSKLLNTRPLMDLQDTYALRGVCMLMIMFHHLMKNAVDPICTGIWGDLGTAVFFILSGWGLCSSMEKHEHVGASYLVKNIRKLLVPFYIVWVVCCIIVSLFVDTSYFSSGWHVVRDIVTLTYPLTWPGIWFIKVIFVEYVVTIVSFMLFRNKILQLTLPTIVTLIYIVIAWKILHWSPYLYCTTLCFVIGLWGARFHKQLDIKLLCKVVGLILFLGLYMFTKRYPIPPLPHLMTYAVAFCFFMIFLVSVININNPILHFIGKNSLLFYLIHIPVIHYTFMLFPCSTFNPWTKFALLVVVTGGLSVLVKMLNDNLTNQWQIRRK